MKNLKSVFVLLSAFVFVLFLSGCTHDTGFKPVDDLILDNDQPEVEDSVIDELTPIVTIGDDVAVAVYACTTDTDCNRCKDGDVYGQNCVTTYNDQEKGTCQGELELIENCEDGCSAGACEEAPLVAEEEPAYKAGEDLDPVEEIEEIIEEEYNEGIVDNDDLLPPTGECTNVASACIGYRGAGSAYISAYPECACKLVYVPAGCNPNDPLCPGYGSRSNYPDCACQ